MHDDSFLSFRNISQNTPNRNISYSKLGTPDNFSSEQNINSFLNDSGRIKTNNITDATILYKKFYELEKSIQSYCGHYTTIKKIFDIVDIDIKNKILLYLTEFNEKCKEKLYEKTDNFISTTVSNEKKKQLKENFDKKTEEFNNLEIKYKKEKEEMKENFKKDNLKIKNDLKEAEDTIKKLNMKIKENEYKLEEKNKQINFLKEQLNSSDQPIGQDYINIKYDLDDATDNTIKINCPTKKEFESFSSKFDKVQKNFDIYTNLLVETSNEALEKFKYLYYKMKGKEWNDTNNSLIKKYNYDIFDVNQEMQQN